jgi:hypothetical protein
LENVVFIVTSFWAYGELCIAIDFAHRLKNAGINPIFIIPPSHEGMVRQNHFYYQLLIPKAAKLNRIILKEVEILYQPKAIFLADFLNYSFCEQHYGLTMDDLSIFSGKIGAFDLYDFETAHGCVDTYGFQAKNMKRLSVNDYDILLQPCPVNHISSPKSPNVFRYGLFGNITERVEEDIEKNRFKIGLKRDERMILMTSAIWQHTYRSYHEVEPFIKACYRALEKIISGLPCNYKIFLVGASSIFKNCGDQRFIQINQMPPEQFYQLMMAADVFVSNNYISTSMLKIVLSGIPTLLLKNSFLKRNGVQRWVNGAKLKPPKLLADCSLAYPFRMYPVGWYKFLEHIVRENPFYSLLLQAELFETQGVIQKIRRLANEGPSLFKKQRDIYLNTLHTLPGVEQCLIAVRKAS